MPLPRDWKECARRALLCAVGLERLALAEVRAGFEQALDPRARLVAELDALRAAHAVQAEELRICRARLRCLRPQERPHYPPAERLSILLLRARAGWNAAETARRFLVTAATIAAWMRRLDEQGHHALVKPAVPVNRFSDAVALLVQQLHQVAPGFGRRKLAEVLARAGVGLAASTARRLLERRPQAPLAPPPNPGEKRRDTGSNERVVTAKRPHHVWHADLTVIGIGTPGFGFWAPWWPFALVLRWAMSWHVAVLVDHFSRSFLAFALFRKEPTAQEVCALLERAVQNTGVAPRYIITDRGAQFGNDYRAWCRRHGVRPRYGAVGKKGSIALVERFILSLKSELLWKVFVPASQARMHKLIGSYQRWYNDERPPHASLGGLTPAEVLAGRLPVSKRRVASWSRRARGHPNISPHNQLELHVTYVGGNTLLPVVSIRQAA